MHPPEAVVILLASKSGGIDQPQPRTPAGWAMVNCAPTFFPAGIIFGGMTAGVLFTLTTLFQATTLSPLPQRRPGRHAPAFTKFL